MIGTRRDGPERDPRNADRRRIRRDTPDRRARIQRREPRYSVPTYSVQVAVEVIIGGEPYSGLLWDISSGACIRSFVLIPPGRNCLARFHKHAGDEILECEARLIWSDSVLQAYFTGLQFHEPITSSHTFLSRLLEIVPPKPDRRGTRGPGNA
ncbi:PilZ domain-containing protein [Cyanobium sp. FGCU-52]|nr:PilZ domain-containing protein [Cyanobium sp. FGCU52]